MTEQPPVIELLRTSNGLSTPLPAMDRFTLHQTPITPDGEHAYSKKLTSHFLVPSLKMDGAVPPLPTHPNDMTFNYKQI